ncbi:MAG: T9SS type A sorting domain-containing protein [Ginsengibacter sp.]
MKKSLLLCNLIFFSALTAYCQPPVGNYISATLKQGSAPNSVYITFKSNVTLTLAKFSSFQFELGIPDSITPKPGFTMTSLDPLMSYGTDGAIETQGGITYYGYGFSGDGGQSGPGTTFEQDKEYNYAEVFFTEAPPDITSKVRLMQLPDGGKTINVNFYVANKGADVTNQPAQFYSSDPLSVSNDGAGYKGSSYVTLPTVVLPIKLSGFSANNKDGDAILNWSVENLDAQSSSFEIEKSLNGTNFENIGAVNLSSNTGNNYSFTDRNVNVSDPATVVYYRLKMLDKDGQFTYSEIKNIRLYDKGLNISLYPNPTMSSSKLNLNLDNPGVVRISITNILGKQVRQIEFNGLKGFNQKNIDLSGISAGSYMIKVQINNSIQTIPVIKE